MRRSRGTPTSESLLPLLVVAGLLLPAATFAAPERPAVPTVTLAEALRLADERNLDLAAVRQEIDKAAAAVSTTWGLVLPILQGSLEYQHFDHEDSVDLAGSFAPLLTAMGITLPPGTSLGDPLVLNRQDQLHGALTAVLPLINLKSWFTIGAAQSGEALAELSFADARQSLLLGVARTFCLTRMAQEVLALHEGNVRSAEQHLRVARQRRDAGAGMPIDVIRAETDLEQARQEHLAARAALDSARDGLGLLLDAAAAPLPATPPAIAAPTEDSAGLERRALADRTDLAAARARATLADDQLTAAWMEFVPTLELIGNLSHQFTDPPDLGSDDQTRWVLMLNIKVPLYDHFRYATLDERAASLRQAELQRAATEKRAALEVRQARRDHETAQASVALAERQANLAREGLALVEAAYEAGAGASLDVTEARRLNTAAGVNLAAQRLQAQVALLELHRATGRDLRALVEGR